jgi:hypothetical protein
VSASVWAALLLLACSEAGAVEQRFFVPEGLPNTELEGEGGLTLIAFTLQQRPERVELLATVRHDGDEPACEPGMLVHFSDHRGALLASVGSTLYGGKLYRLDDAAGTLVRCLPPGEIGMAALVDVPDQVVLDELAYLQHTFPAFTLSGLAPVEGALELAAQPTDHGYEVTLENALDFAVADPKVAIFSVNRVKRPLGVATGGAELLLLPGETCKVSTTTVAERGVERVAHAIVTLNSDQSAAGRE